MTKEIFLQELTCRLQQFPTEEVDRQRLYYEELLEDMIEDGLSEEAAVEKLGAPDTIASEILQDIPLQSLVKHRLRPKNGWTGAAIALTALGAPLWLPLLLALLLTSGAMFLAFCSMIAALFISVLALVCAGLLTLLRGFGLFTLGGGYAVFTIGAGFILLGLTCLTFLVAKYASIGLYRSGRWLLNMGKGLLVKKGV